VKLRCNHPCGIMFAALVLLLAMEHAGAQRLIVVSQGLSAAREAAKIYVHSVAMHRPAPLPGVQALEGGELTGPLLLTPDYSHAIVGVTASGITGSREDINTRTFISDFSTQPFERLLEVRRRSEIGWKERSAGIFNDPGKTGDSLVLLGWKEVPSDAPQGKVELLPWPPPKNKRLARPAIRWNLPGKPLDAVLLGDNDLVVALYARGSAGEPALMIGNSHTGQLQQENIRFCSLELTPESHPAGMALSRDKKWLFVAVTGFSLSTPAGETASWVYALNTTTFAPLGDPVEIAGIAQPGSSALCPAMETGVWIATRTRGTDFAQATFAAVENDAFLQKVEYAVAGVSQQFHLTVSPDGQDIAAALDNRLEIWPKGVRGDHSVDYEDPIRVMRWTGEGLFLGEGNRLHAVDVSNAKSLNFMALQSGWVADIALIPSAFVIPSDADADSLTDSEEVRIGSSPDDPDSDHDGLPDGSDPDSTAPTPWLETRPLVEFREDAMGREIQTLRIHIHNGESAPWQIAFNQKSLPWLRISPLSGQGPGYVYMGVDPARYSPAQATGGELQVKLSPKEARTAWNTGLIRVSVTPGRPAPDTILWIWPDERQESLRDPSDPRKLRALADMLAGPPYYFAHREASSPYHESLDRYAVVVLNAAAAAQGALTRQAVLDYVAQGGSLLFLGQYLENERMRGLAQWLSPLAIRIYTGIEVNGRFEVAGEKRLVRYWRDFLITKGCAIGAEKGYALEPGGVTGVGAVFVAREYGLGRIALIAAPTPLQSDALRGEDERTFAGKLFSWLANARREYSDSDEDGLPDGTEDNNDNGNADPGETDYRNPDTDGDGLPDGVEDANRNGSVDDGETDPRNPDSDSDGILDGADSKPCPIFGSPVLFSITPAVPAEGGRLLMVSGANLTSDSEFWFGDRKAPWSRTIGGDQAWVIVPDSGEDEGGIVPVKVKAGGGTLEGTLPGGYQYAPRSRVRFLFQPTMPPKLTDKMYTGELALRYETPDGVSLGRAALLVHNAPQQGFSWKEARPGITASVAKRTVMGKASPEGFLVNLESGNRFPANNGELMRLVWTWDPAKWDQQPITLEVGAVHAFTRRGDHLAVTLEPYEFNGISLKKMSEQISL